MTTKLAVGAATALLAASAGATWCLFAMSNTQSIAAGGDTVAGTGPTAQITVTTGPTCNSDDIFVGNFSAGTVVRFSKADIAVNGNASASTVIGSGLGTVEGITLDFDGTVIATTRFNSTVYRFDRTGTPNCIIEIVTTVEGPSFDAARNLFVNDTSTPITYKSAPNGGCPNMLSPVAWINTYPSGTFLEDTRISPSTAPMFPSSLYILGSFGSLNNPNSIQAWSDTTPNTMLGTVIADFGTAAGLGAGAYRSLGIAFDSQGDIWVADFTSGAGDGRLLEFNSAGVFQRAVPIPGSSRGHGKMAISGPNPGDPLNPNKNTIFVTDQNNNRLYIVDEVTGTVLYTLTSNLDNPVGVAVCDVIVAPPPTPTPIPGPTPIIHVRSNPTPRVREGGTAYFMVEADRVLGNPVTVTYSLSGNATLNSDYTLTPFTPPYKVTIPAGQVRTPVRLDAYQDGIRERRGESATMTIELGMGYAVYNGKHPPFKTATIKILD